MHLNQNAKDLKNVNDFIEADVEKNTAEESIEYSENFLDPIQNEEYDEEEYFQSDDDTNDLTEEEQTPIIEMELKKPTAETKQKLRRMIERHYRFKASKATKAPPNDRTELVPTSKPSTRHNIRSIIKKEKIKEMIEKISQIDLRKVCDERESTKQCLLKIIDSYID